MSDFNIFLSFTGCRCWRMKMQDIALLHKWYFSPYLSSVSCLLRYHREKREIKRNMKSFSPICFNSYFIVFGSGCINQILFHNISAKKTRHRIFFEIKILLLRWISSLIQILLIHLNLIYDYQIFCYPISINALHCSSSSIESFNISNNQRIRVQDDTMTR